VKRVVLALALILAVGCGGRGGSPARALDAYGQALREHDFAAAYRMMAESFRSKYSEDEFVRMMKDSGGESGETASRIAKGRKAVEIRADFVYGYGDTMRLVQEDGAWRIATDPLEFYSQATPREAVRSFVRAYRLQRWDVMLRFVPTRYREKMTIDQLRTQFAGAQREQIAAMMKAIESNLDAPITEKGRAEARMAYGERAEVKLTLEDGLWKVQDLD
jgi:hypothetical protein